MERKNTNETIDILEKKENIKNKKKAVLMIFLDGIAERY